MKKIIMLATSIFMLDAHAFQPGVQRKANYYYFELVPNDKLIIKLQSDKRCIKDTDRISVDEFESLVSYPSTENKEKVPVRIKSIFAESFSICSNQPIGKTEKKITIGPYKTQMTHIRLTVSEGIEVSHTNDCGAFPQGYCQLSQ